MRCLKAAAALAVTLALAACATHLERPVFTLLSVSATELRFDEQRFRVRLHVTNPNDIALPVTGLRCTVELAGSPFGEGALSQPLTVPAHGGSDLELELSTHLAMSLPPILARLNSNQPLDYHLVGDVETGLLFAPRIHFEDRASVRLRAAPEPPAT